MICYTFSSAVPLEEVESSLLLALFGTESLHGETSTRLDAAHRFDRSDRQVVIDTQLPLIPTRIQSIAEGISKNYSGVNAYVYWCFDPTSARFHATDVA